MLQTQRQPTTIILGPSRNVLIWSDGISEDITESEAEALRSEGRISMTITAGSDAAVDLTARVCAGELPIPREGTTNE